MLDQHNGELVRLGGGAVAVATGTDFRGLTVVDAGGSDLGKVEDVFVDAEGIARFLGIAHGGFLGIGGSKVMVPVEAIRDAGDEQLRLGRMKSELEGAPDYEEPPASDAMTYWMSLYTHYGYRPYWAKEGTVHDPARDSGSPVTDGGPLPPL